MPEPIDALAPGVAENGTAGTGAAETGAPAEAMAARIRAVGPGLVSLLAEANATWEGRSGSTAETDPEPRIPGWRSFEDAFPTFYQFTNRPR